MAELSEEENIEIGNQLISLLGLKVKKNGRVDTSWGDKTPLGLTLTIKRVFDDAQHKPTPPTKAQQNYH